MTLSNQLHPYTKGTQLAWDKEPNQRQKGDISAKVRKRVNARTLLAPVGCCEGCMRNRNGYWTLELAHIDSRRAIEHKTTEYDLLRLCGPSTNPKTCHGWIHANSKVSRSWVEGLQERLIADVQ